MKVTVLTPCYNEKENILELYRQIKAAIATLSGYEFTHLFIDNCSNDGTQEILRKLAEQDPRVQVIFNARNFGHIRSPIHGLFQAVGDAVILMASDLQDPPELIPPLIREWERGAQMVMAVKTESDESRALFFIRKSFYRGINFISNIKMVENFTGTGLYSRFAVDTLKSLDEPFPYLRGLVCELGFLTATVPFKQPLRSKGVTKNNLCTLGEMAILAMTQHSRVPMRLAMVLGLVMSVLSAFLAVGYLAVKLVFWHSFQVSLALVLIGGLFIGSVQLFFLGLLGEYVGAILTRVQQRPYVIERERLNF